MNKKTALFSLISKKWSVFLKYMPVSNERSGNLTFCRGIYKFLNPYIFDKITFLTNAVIAISKNFL